MNSGTAIISPSELTALAMLKANWDQNGKGYLDSFLPFISAALSNIASDVEVYQIRDSLSGEFGLRLPLGTVENLLRRGCKLGLYRQRDRKFSINSPDEGLELWARRNEILKKQGVLLAKFMDFAAREYHEELSRKDAEDRLLRQVERASVPVLKAWLRGEKLNDDSRGTADSDYTTSRFILNLYENDRDGFSDLETIVQGNMLASALYYAPNLRSISSHFKSTYVALDTPILLRALGYEGSAEQEVASETLELATGLGAQLVCFKRTFQELKSVLAAISFSLIPGNRAAREGGATRAYFLGEKKTPSDIELLITQLESNLRAKGIRIIEQPPYSAPHAINEKRLEKVLREKVRYRNDQAVLHDLDVLTAIYRFRAGEVQHHLEDCKAIFITPNANVVHAGREYFEDEGISDLSWPLVLLDHVFATVLWLKSPQEAPDLPRKQLIANSYAGLVPSVELWNKFLTELDKLSALGSVVEDHYGYLRYSLDAQRLLMTQTRGDENRFNEGTIYDIVANFEEKYQPERDLEDKNGSSSSGDKTGEDAAALQRIEKAETRVRAAESELSAIRLRLNHLSQLLTDAILVITGGLLLTVICTAAWVGLPPPIGPSLSAVPQSWAIAIKILAIAGAFSGLAGIVLGSVRGVMLAGRQRLRRWILRGCFGQTLD